MRLIDLVNRNTPPAPWSEGDKIPWNDPDFSRRMLAIHLDQDNDWASRREILIDAHVSWIAKHFLGSNAAVLGLGCGPGLYLERLAGRGHKCTGIDFSPAAVDHARTRAGRQTTCSGTSSSFTAR